MSFRHGAWLLPVAFAAHVAEEAPGFTAWARRNAAPDYTAREFWRNNALGMAGTLAATAAVARPAPRRSLVWAWYCAVLTQEALFNSLFHAGTAVAWREYSPGLATSLGLFLPLWGGLTRAALRERLVTTRGVIGATVVAGMMHAGVVAQQVFHAGRS